MVLMVVVYQYVCMQARDARHRHGGGLGLPAAAAIGQVGGRLVACMLDMKWNILRRMKCDAFERAGPRRTKVDMGLLGGAQEQEKSNLVMGIIKCVEASIYLLDLGSGEVAFTRVAAARARRRCRVRSLTKVGQLIIRYPAMIGVYAALPELASCSGAALNTLHPRQRCVTSNTALALLLGV